VPSVTRRRLNSTRRGRRSPASTASAPAPRPFSPATRGCAEPIVWDERTLDAWLADPRGLLDGKNTAMTLRLNDAEQRDDVIAYLKTLR
jgi:cytochrome c2